MSHLVTPWRTRLAAMDHTRGTTGKMIQEAMRGEIADLRKLMEPKVEARFQAKLAQTKSTKVEDMLRAQLVALQAKSAKVEGKLREQIAALKAKPVLAKSTAVEDKLRAQVYSLKLKLQTPAKSTAGDATLRATVRDLRSRLAGHNRVVERVKESRDEWKATALRYQKQLIERP